LPQFRLSRSLHGRAGKADAWRRLDMGSLECSEPGWRRGLGGWATETSTFYNSGGLVEQTSYTLLMPLKAILRPSLTGDIPHSKSWDLR
jgi:hypothetical protein